MKNENEIKKVNVEVYIKVNSLMYLGDVVKATCKVAEENPYVNFHIEAVG